MYNKINGAAIRDSVTVKAVMMVPILTCKAYNTCWVIGLRGSVFFKVREAHGELQILVDELHAELAEHLVLTVAGVVERLAVEYSAFNPAEVVEYRCCNREGSGGNEGVSVLRHESGPFKEG